MAAEPVPTHRCRDCQLHLCSGETLAQHDGHGLEPSGILYLIPMPTIDSRRPVGIWVHDGACYLIRHDCPLESGYPLGALFGDPIYSPPQKDEILRWVDELELPF